jgi:hypothetical protein
MPGEIDVIVKRAIERDPAIRYQTWQQFSDDLAAVASGSPLPKHGVLETEKFNSLRHLAFFRSFSRCRAVGSAAILRMADRERGTAAGERRRSRRLLLHPGVRRGKGRPQKNA